VTSAKHSDAAVKLGFEMASLRIAISDIQPLRMVSPQVKKSAKYRQICASIREVGIIEPPLVARLQSGRFKFLLVAGHLRIEALKDMGEAEVVCLIAKDDDGYTPNKHISRLATVQQSRMILKAIERGVPAQRIAKTLNIDVSSLRERMRLLNGICAEAVELLKDKHVPMSAFRSLRKMVPLRQIEAVELMIAMNNYTASCANWLLAATPQSQLVEADKPKKMKGLTDEQMGMMERESANLDKQYKMIEQSYGSDQLELMLARGFLTNLLANGHVVRYLAKHQAEILSAFQKLVDADRNAA
jgi:RepB plasmid partitioning protein/ParB-like nuclease family protein